MQIDYSLPAALFNFKSPIQNNPSTVTQAAADIQYELHFLIPFPTFF